MVMGNMKKYYSGSISNETTAARVYDRFSIQNLGLRAKTNFDYKREELINIINEMEESLKEENHNQNPLVNTIILKNAKKNLKENKEE